MYVFKCFSFKQTNKIPKTPLDLRDTDHWLRACLVFTRGPGFLPQHHKNNENKTPLEFCRQWF